MEGWMQGSLARIKLKNFVTYDSVEFRTGPHLNIIIGPNGTGKSSIVCALCLGLGGKTNLLGRAREIGEFVKHGTHQATIELELFNKDGLNYTIKRIITRENKSDWAINKKPVNLKDVTALVKKLNIDVNNLCQFLPQDMVAEFAKMTPHDLLKSTERAVGGEDMLKLHKELIELKNDHKSVSTSQASKEEYLDKLMKRNDYLKDIVSKHEERSQHLEKIEVLQLKRPWLLYEVARVEFMKLKKEVEVLKATRDKLKEAAKPLQKNLDKKKDNESDAKNALSTMTNELNRINSGIKSIECDVGKNNDHLVDIQEEYKSKVKDVEQRQRQMNEIVKELDAWKNELETLPSTEELTAKRDGFSSKCKLIQKELYQLENKQGELAAEEQARKSKQAMFQAKINKLNNVKDKKLNNLRQYEKDTYNAVEWLENNRSMFQGEVLEPIQLSLNVPNTANGKFIESIISRNDRKAFIFERKDDLNLFMKKLRDEQKLCINAVLAPPDENFTSSFDPNQLKSLGFVGFLSDLIECPRLAKRFLCRYYRIHNVPVGTNSVDNNIERINKVICSGLYFSPTHRYQNNKSRYSSDTISSISRLKDARIFNMTVDKSEIQRLQNELNQTTQESSEAREKYEQVTKNIAELKNKELSYRDEKNRALQQIKSRQDYANKIRSREEKIENLQNLNVDLEKEKEKCKKSSQATLQKNTHMVKKMLQLYLQLERKLNEKNQAAVQKILIGSEVLEAEETLQSSTRGLQCAVQDVADKEDAFKSQRTHARALLEEAKRACNLDRDNLPNNFKSMFKRYPCSDVNDLDQQLNEAKALAECSGEVDPQVITEYKNRKKEIETYAQEVEGNQDRLGALDQKMAEVREKWYGPVTRIVENINTKFRSFFSKMKCAGEVILSEHEDYDKWGIDIRVQFRNSDDMQRLTSSYQSGGEKAVSTILYLLSLQGLTFCPFRVVDEINQGMDPKNERKVFEMMAEAATLAGTSQYFLITPKLLPDLSYNERMSILSIFNGLGLDNSPLDDSFVVERVIERNQIRMSQLDP